MAHKTSGSAPQLSARTLCPAHEARETTKQLVDRSIQCCRMVRVGRTTGREMVLNTSFNVKGQPIVNTPAEAMETFLGTGIEFLFLENTLVSRTR